MDNDHRPSEDLLVSNHTFPGVYQIKAIGAADDDFAARVVEAAAQELASPGEIDHVVRSTPNGKHVSLTLDITVQTPDQVRAIYARLREVRGVTLLF